jgi:tRNA_anti-like
MSIFECKECGQRISDKAASCPGCGAPVAGTAPPARRGRTIAGVFLALVAMGLFAAAFWQSVPPDRLAGMVRLFDRSGDRTPAVSAPVHRAALVEHIDTMAPGVYETTAEQLYRDYSANPVAAQGKIGGRRIRVTGRVAAIDEDASGHPQVMLGTSTDDTVDLLLGDDQKAAVAELAKGDAVEIQCDKIHRDQARPAIASPQGSGCGLVLVDVRTADAYLAVSMSADKGSAPLYIVGPMPKDVCQARSDRISNELAADLKHDHVIAKNCGATAHDNIPLEGCRLSSSMSAIPDLPMAHLWKYECDTRRAPSRPTQAAAPRKSVVQVALSTDPDVTDADADIVASLPTFAPPIAAPSVSPTVTSAVTPAVSPAQESAPAANPLVAAGMLAAGGAAAGGAAIAQAAQNDAPGSAGAAPATAKSATVPSDLSSVKATDPGAAEHIASYCDTATATAANQSAVAAGCRHEEVAAWTRLVLQNEFPTMDDATRRKCSQPPFPDSYVAKESCAKYQLHVN